VDEKDEYFTAEIKKVDEERSSAFSEISGFFSAFSVGLLFYAVIKFILEIKND
jgi:hypothetical protein